VEVEEDELSWLASSSRVMKVRSEIVRLDMVCWDWDWDWW
jgi:hypothetical protein